MQGISQDLEHGGCQPTLGGPFPSPLPSLSPSLPFSSPFPFPLPPLLLSRSLLSLPPPLEVGPLKSI